MTALEKLECLRKISELREILSDYSLHQTPESIQQRQNELRLLTQALRMNGVNVKDYNG